MQSVQKSMVNLYGHIASELYVVIVEFCKHYYSDTLVTISLLMTFIRYSPFLFCYNTASVMSLRVSFELSFFY